MPEQYKALQGFKDILPDEQPYWKRCIVSMTGLIRKVTVST